MEFEAGALYRSCETISLMDDGDVLVTRKKMNSGKSIVERQSGDVSYLCHKKK